MKCLVCGNNIKDGMSICPICGAGQNTNIQDVNQPIYNNQYQQPVNNSMIPPYSQYQQPIYPNQIYYNNMNQKKKTWMDIVSVVCGCIGIYYLFSLFVVISQGLQSFINETFNSPDMIEILEEPLTATLCMTWPLFLAPIPGIIFGIMGRSKIQNKLNIFGIISNVVCLCSGIITTIYIYNFMIG